MAPLKKIDTTSSCDGCDKYEVWCFVEFWTTVGVMSHVSGFICLCVPGWVFVYLSVTKKRLVESILNNWAGHEPSSWCTRTPGLLASAVYLITTVPVPVQSIWSEQLATPGMIFNDQNCARWLWTIKICRDWLRGSFPGHMHQKNRNMCHIYLVREAVIKKVCPKSVPSPHPPSVHLGLKISLLAKEVGFTKPKTHF